MALLRPEKADIARADFTLELVPDRKDQEAYADYQRMCARLGIPAGPIQTYVRTNRDVADNWYRFKER